MSEADLCPICNQRRLPVMPEGTRFNARRCQNCGVVFSVPDGQRLGFEPNTKLQRLDPDVRKGTTRT